MMHWKWQNYLPLLSFIGCMNCPINITCTNTTSNIIVTKLACMTNCYPVEPLPFFSPSLHKFNWEFYPSIRTEDEACTLGVVHNATDINLLFCFLLRTPRDAAYENQCHFASLSHGMQAKKKIIVPRKIFPWHNISVKEKLVVCTI